MRSLRYRRLVNRLIDIMNRKLLPAHDMMPRIPIVLVETNGHLEEVVWKYSNLIDDNWADQRDDGRARAKEIAKSIQIIEKEHGEQLREYLRPYADAEWSEISSLETHRLKVAREIFPK